jgi:hypothetical protein
MCENKFDNRIYKYKISISSKILEIQYYKINTFFIKLLILNYVLIS